MRSSAALQAKESRREDGSDLGPPFRRRHLAKIVNVKHAVSSGSPVNADVRPMLVTYRR
jgi:hypothetical protein